MKTSQRKVKRRPLYTVVRKDKTEFRTRNGHRAAIEFRRDGLSVFPTPPSLEPLFAKLRLGNDQRERRVEGPEAAGGAPS